MSKDKWQHGSGPQMKGIFMGMISKEQITGLGTARMLATCKKRYQSLG